MLNTLADNTGKAFALFGKRFQTFDGKQDTADYDITINDEVSKVFVGMSLRLSLRDVLLASHREKALPGLPEYKWGRRHKLYAEIDKVTMKEYAEKFLAGDYPGKCVDELLKESELKAFADKISGNANIKIFHNYDDFLLSADERTYLDRQFKDNLTWFSNGGHLGNLYYLPVRNTLLSTFKANTQK